MMKCAKWHRLKKQSCLIFGLIFMTAVLYSVAVADAENKIRVGFYSAVPMNATREAKMKRMKELKLIGVNTIIESQYVQNEHQHSQSEQLLNDLHTFDIQLTSRITRDVDWFGSGGKGDFNSAKAENKLKEASTNSRLIDYLYLAHEVHEFATHDQRVEMYKIAKRYFPKTPVVMYYGGAVDRMESREKYSKYRYGPGETDIALIGVLVKDKDNKYGTVNIAATLERLRRVSSIIKKRSPLVKIWVVASFAPDDGMKSTKESMWSPELILTYGKSLVQSGEIDGLFFRSFGRFKYDLGYAEWEKQRTSVRTLFKTVK